MKYLAALLLAGLASCSFVEDECAGTACGMAGPPVEVTVRNATEATVDVFRQDGLPVDIACEEAGAGLVCSATTAAEPQAGVYAVDVEADGYQPVHLDVTVDATAPGGCCNPGYVGEQVLIDMTP